MKSYSNKKLDEFLEWMKQDAPNEFAIPDLEMVAKVETGQDILDYFITKLKGDGCDDTFTLHYLGIIGIKEVSPILENHLFNGKDEEEVFWAAVGLAHLGNSDSFIVLRQFAERSHPLSDFIHPYDDVLEELEKIKDKRACNLIKLFQAGKFGKPTDRF